MRRRSVPFAFACAALLLGGCYGLSQRVPGPIGRSARGGESAATGGAPEEFPVIVQRDSDPVWIRRPGEGAEYSLPFHRKRERIAAGAGVRTGSGGRAEVLWADDASAVILFDKCALSVGDPEVDEPIVRFHTVTRALLSLTPEDRVALPGGALLRGDPAQPTGLLLVEEAGVELVRVTNQSKLMVRISYREADLDLSPGETIDLPVPSFGSVPLVAGPEPVVLGPDALTAELVGRAESSESDGGLLLRGVEESAVSALGIELHLAAGDQAIFLRPGASAPGAPAPSAPATE